MNTSWLLVVALLFAVAVVVSVIALWTSGRWEKSDLYYWGPDGPMMLRDGEAKRLTGRSGLWAKIKRRIRDEDPT